MSLLMASASVVYAEDVPTCEGSKFVIPVKGITFGMKQDAALKVLKTNNPKLIITSNADGIKMVYPKQMQDIFDEVRVQTMDGYVVEILISYSNSFQDGQGGPAKAAMNLIKNVIEKYGKADSQDQVDKGFRITWESDRGVGFRITAKDPYTVVMGLDCEILAAHLAEKKRKSTNFGF